MSRRQKVRVPELINRLVDIGTQRLMEDAGVSEDRARFVMREVAHVWCREHGGTDFYMPKDTELRLEKRDEEIWRKFDGRNGQELAYEYDLSERQVRIICAVMRRRVVARTQHQLPGFDDPLS